MSTNFEAFGDDDKHFLSNGHEETEEWKQRPDVEWWRCNHFWMNGHLNFAVKKGAWCRVVERVFFNLKNQFFIASFHCKSFVLDKNPIKTPIENAWMVSSGN